MSGRPFSGKLFFIAAGFCLFLLTAIRVFSAQEALRPPQWVGIYSAAGRVGLKWNPSAGAVKYKIYRTVTSGKSRELLATVADTSFIDATARQGETYYYSLKSVSDAGKESGFSDERYIKVPVAGGGLPVRPPEWVGALVGEKSIQLAWLPSPSSNAVAYNIYRSRERGKGFQLIGSTQDTNFTDANVKEGETYFYALTTLNKEFKETKFGEIRAVTFSLPKEVPEGQARGGHRRAPGAAPEAPEFPQKIIAKPTRIIGYILKGKDDLPLFSPTDVALGPDGNIYVADTGSSLIQVFKPGGEFVRAIGGFGKEGGKFEKLLGIDVDDRGYVFATDAYTGKIQEFDKEGHLLMRKNMRDDAKLIAEDLGLKVPITTFGIVKTIVSPDGSIYTLDNFNDCIEVFSRNGKYIKAFGGKGIADGKFQGPTFAAFNKAGDLLVSDCMNARVQVFSGDGKFLWKFGGYGNIAGTFSRPKGLAVDGSGRIYVADSMANVVQVFDKEGRFVFLLADERGKQMDLATPNGIAVDKKRRIYMVEKLINRVQIRQVGE